MTIRISVAFDDSLQVFRNRVVNLEPAYKQVGEYLRKVADDRFRNQAGPNGQPWVRLSDAYARQKQKKGRIPKILQSTGGLRDSINYRATRDYVEIGTGLMVGRYNLGAIHQFGSQSKNLPARPFLGISQDDERAIIEIVRGFVLG